MRNPFTVSKHDLSLDIILFVIRVVCGYAFILFGWGKIQHPLSWMGPDSAYPGFLQALAAISEFVGGIALILGFLTRLAAFGIACTMLVAIYTHKFQMGDPFVNLTGGGSYQVPVLYLLVALLLMVAGPGRISLDRLFFGWEGSSRKVAKYR
jgi:putative oxidoreductase